MTYQIRNKYMAQGDQVKNGKAFEYAIARTYVDFLRNKKLNVVLADNKAFNVAKAFYEDFSEEEKDRYNECAFQTIDTMMRLEPGLYAQKNENDTLHVFLNDDAEGEDGDVRDVVFMREQPTWEVGFSAKNNNDAVKHSRLSSVLDFGDSWVNVPCSQSYWDAISPIFEYLECAKNENKTWNELGDEKATNVYIPLLRAFRNELLKINSENECIPQKLVKYLVGQYPFYKIIKDDTHNMVIVKAFNINGELNKTVNKNKPQYKTPAINLPTRIVEFEMKQGSDNTLNMILDGGWEISFRIHNASSKVEKSLKFDIKLLGNPPILFTQHLFQDK